MKTIVPIFLLVFVVSCIQSTRKAEPAATVAVEEPTFQESAAVEPVAAPALIDTPPITAPPAIEVPAETPVTEEPQAEVVPPGSTAAQVAPPAGRVPGAAPAATAAEGAPPAAGETLSDPEQIIPAGMIDFRNTPLEQVLTVYSELVNRTLLRPSTLPASQITLTTRTALTKREAVQALDSVLGLNGIAMINVDEKFVKAVAQPQAVQEAAPPDTRRAAELPEFGPVLTHVVQLKYTKPAEVVPALQPFAKLNSILPVESTQILVLRDYTENIKRMLEMIERIDIVVPGEFVSEVIPIKYAKAAEIADALNSLSGSGGGSTSIGRSTGSTRPAVGNTSGGLNRPGGLGGVGGYNQANPMQSGGIGGIGGAAGSAPGSSFTDRLRNIVQRAAASGDLEILGKTKMIADERSNSLLIFASRADMDMIKTVVAKLDVVLSQVLIETVIMDVNMGNTLNYGVTAGQHPKTNALGTIGGVYNNGGSLGTLANFFGGVSTNGGGSAFPQSSGLTYMGRYKGDLDVVVTAAATDSRINVVQKPRILTSHATPGSIFVGSTVPYVTSTYYGGGFGGGPSSSYQQLQVGIGLTVTPYINPEGLVVMQIDETIDEVSGSIPITGVGEVPTTTSRKLSAEVAVNDGDTILLGGFIRNSSNKSDSGVPLLKDIPLLGALFSSKNNSKARNELLVLMRPTVLKTPEIAAMATVQEKKSMPGISNAEAEVQEIERLELEKEEKRAAARRRAAEQRQNQR
ncbi:MAG TPA: secretin N-terminal domain-containing protein [Verrucomicrobiae bacterium]|nr:secretin N-terminal domain-containing protein [Verrucomicrobiae bacterium]